VLLDLAVQGQDVIKVLLQEVQHNSLTGSIIHADFHEISMTEKLRVEVQIHLTGTPVGVTQGGGVLEHLLREVEVECLPSDLMEFIEVDVSNLNIGDNLTVADIKLDAARYHILSQADLAVAGVAAPAAEEEKPAEEAVAGAEAAEPEVIKEKKPAAGEDDKGAKAPAAKGAAAAPAAKAAKEKAK
jgi:large subunit ribosomal protein L25